MNLRLVSHLIARSDQPNVDAFEVLYAAGVRNVLSLRVDGESRFTPFAGGAYDLGAEQTAVQKLGMEFYSIPIGDGPFSAPTYGQVDRALALLNNGKTWLIHCRRGADRTGLIVACYRVQCEGWTKERATAEANDCGMSRLQWKMREFLEDFGSTIVINERPQQKK